MTTRGSHAQRRPAAERPTPARPARRRGAGAPLLICAALAVAVLVLGASGTLSSWTQAIITNDTNNVATATAVVLQEAATGVAQPCVSSSVAANSSTCSTINKYGGTATPLQPGGSQTTSVTFTNIGGANASSFSLAQGTAGCTQSPTAGTGTPVAANLCTNGDLTVAVSCSPGSTYASTSAWSDLSYAAAAPLTATKTHAASSGDLNKGATWTCQFTVALSSNAAVADQGITLSQPLVWTLTK
jgi:hypothetical protein